MKNLKKFVCLFVCIIMCLTAVGCNSQNTSSDPEGIDVEYYVKHGKLPECEYSLGGSALSALTELEARQENNPLDYFVSEIVRDDYTMIITNGYNYCYLPAVGKINTIVSFDTAFGYPVGTVSIEIKDDLAMRGFESAERDLTAEETLLIPGISQCTCLEYTFGNNTVLFVFQENALCATAIFPTYHNP